MPKVAMDYSKTHFYKIVCKDLSIKECYVGHTTNLMKRKHHHKNLCINPNNKQYNSFKYQFIRNNRGWDNWDIVLIKTESCENSLEAVRKEREYIEELQATLNKVRPMISQEEFLMKDKIYYQNNKEKFSKNKKIHYENNKEAYSNYAKQYYKQKSEQVKLKSKELYDNKKEEINKKRSMKMTCECGAIVRCGGIWQHKKSIIHQDYINSLQED